jgi:copper chaperone NosL
MLRATMFANRSAAVATAALLLGALAACGRHAVAPPQQAVAIPDDAVSASCGMRIAGTPGPRGEAWVAGNKTPLIFGSTRDLLAYMLQPDNKARLQQAFVQDSARIDWRHVSPAAATFVAARRAYYVAWQTLPGAMGPTFATFARRQDAEAFRRAHGGTVLSFDRITPEMVTLLSYRCPGAASPLAAVAAQCRNGPAPAGAGAAPADMGGMAGMGGMGGQPAR